MRVIRPIFSSFFNNIKILDAARRHEQSFISLLRGACCFFVRRRLLRRGLFHAFDVEATYLNADYVRISLLFFT